MGNKLRHAFQMQKFNAARRGIRFDLTYDQWVCIWEKSEFLCYRGRNGGQYVMARFGDTGPYSIGNVQIIPMEENTRQAWLFKTPEEIIAWKSAAAKGGKKNIGRSRSDLVELNQSRIGKPLSPQHRENIRAGSLGKKRGRYSTWKGKLR